MRPLPNITVVTADLEAYRKMKTRIIAAAALLPPLLVIVLVLPTIWTAVLFGLAAALAAYELLWGTGLVKNYRLIGYTALMAFLVSLWGGLGANYAAALIGVVLFAAILYAEELASKATLRYEKLAVCFAGGLLIPFMLTALVRIHSGENGRFFILIPFVLAFLSDTGAYFAGRAFGKHKLAPIISPNKTIEGVAGGVAGAIAGMLIYCVILDLAFGFTVNYLFAVVYGLIGSLAAVFGDLSFSAIKRQTGIKDYGNLIPGHGGILDRFDSMTVVAPLAEALLLLIPVAVK